jgi:ATP-binding cassette subfamily B protein
MGQWQRIALARALSSDAPIMIFDEPTAWLDREARQNFAQMVGRLQHDQVVIVITHSQDFE